MATVSVAAAMRAVANSCEATFDGLGAGRDWRIDAWALISWGLARGGLDPSHPTWCRRSGRRYRMRRFSWRRRREEAG